jgi:hypothetical protein
VLPTYEQKRKIILSTVHYGTHVQTVIIIIIIIIDKRDEHDDKLKWKITMKFRSTQN